MNGIFQMMDQAVCAFLHITMEQLDYITENSVDNELEEMMEPAFNEKTTISDIKRAIEIRDKYLKSDGIWIQIDSETVGK